MPRTIQDILDHGDELAKRFEDYEPAPDDERDQDVVLALRRAAPPAHGPRDRSKSTAAGWQEAARQRYGSKQEA